MQRRLFFLGILATFVILLTVLFFNKSGPNRDPLPRNQLLDLVWTLHDHGLQFRAISGRPDGLWSDSVYLTQTDKDLNELTRYPATSEFIDHWQGTIFISRNSHESMQSDYTRFGDWELFGDKEFIEEIGMILTAAK